MLSPEPKHAKMCPCKCCLKRCMNCRVYSVFFVRFIDNNKHLNWATNSFESWHAPRRVALVRQSLHVSQAACTCLYVVMVLSVLAAVGGRQPHPAQTRSRPTGQPLRSLLTISPLVPHIFLVPVHLRQEFSGVFSSLQIILPDMLWLPLACCYERLVLRCYNFSSV